MGEMAIMDPKLGDLKVIWDPAKPAEVMAAREQFDKLRAKGYFAYRVDDKGKKKGTAITAFDPEAESMILAPPLVGG